MKQELNEQEVEQVAGGSVTLEDYQQISFGKLHETFTYTCKKVEADKLIRAMKKKLKGIGEREVEKAILDQFKARHWIE